MDLIGRLKNLIRPLYYFYDYYKIRFFYKLKYRKICDAYNIPIIINNFNRLTFLQRLISSLEMRGLTNIHILDNASTYPPLLEFYKKTQYNVIYIGKNVGHLALWKTDIYKRFYRDFYVYTDSDLEIVPECPKDFLHVFLEEMLNNKKIDKIGLGLKIDDLPDHFSNKKDVIEWENQFIREEVNKVFYKANVDTTFALYRPRVKFGANIFRCMYRSKFPYEVRHLPWYLDSQNIQQEDLYYIEHATTTTHWTKKSTIQ
ncbi:MAG TPA: hypothetical protein VL098_08045 [Flavipsychrobacter sp.]|nr:hypothetical protein [Flavipsychrobacter sp.]